MAKKKKTKRTNTGPAMSRVASCYCPDDEPGRGRQVEIRRDNRRGWYVVALLQRGEVTGGQYRWSVPAALLYAANLGYTDVVWDDAYAAQWWEGFLRIWPSFGASVVSDANRRIDASGHAATMGWLATQTR